MYKYIKLQIMIGAVSTGLLYGAADSLSSSSDDLSASMQRVVNYLYKVEPNLYDRSHELHIGIQNFLGTRLGVKNFDTAIQFLYEAKNHPDIQISSTACLYATAVQFLGGDGIERNLAGALFLAEEIVYEQSALPDDRMRAYLIFDEIMHMNDHDVPFQVDRLRKCAAQVAPLASSDQGLNDELCYRLARGFLYEGGPTHKKSIERAKMVLNILRLTEEKQVFSLKQDVNALRQQIEARDERASGMGRIPRSTPIDYALCQQSKSEESDDDIELRVSLRTLIGGRRSPGVVSASSNEGNVASSDKSSDEQALASSSRSSKSVIRLDQPLTEEDWAKIREQKRRASKTKKLRARKKYGNKKD
jgi:hypothetical protein